MEQKLYSSVQAVITLIFASSVIVLFVAEFFGMRDDFSGQTTLVFGACISVIMLLYWRLNP